MSPDNHQQFRDAFGQIMNRPILHTGDCPDCDAGAILREDAPGVFVYAIQHDPTCPFWLALERRRRGLHG